MNELKTFAEKLTDEIKSNLRSFDLSERNVRFDATEEEAVIVPVPLLQKTGDVGVTATSGTSDITTVNVTGIGLEQKVVFVILTFT